MAYTEKVSISGTALSFLLYECSNSTSQEGFLIGDVTSEITNHISDLQGETARLDIQIVIKSVLPLPSVSLFYLPTGKIKEQYLEEVLSKTANDVVGWYKFRKDSNLKPTFRDKLIAKGLQKYFEMNYNKKNFVTCNVTNKTSVSGATHIYMYKFGKINCFNMYEFVEDVTANLGEKVTGYKKPNRSPPQGVFSKIIQDTNIQSNNSNDAILQIQDAVNNRLAEEAKIALKNENSVRELEVEIKQMTSILADKQEMELKAAYNLMMEERWKSVELEMAQNCAEAIVHAQTNNSDSIMDSACSSEELTQLINENERSPSPLLLPTAKPAFNYAAAVKTNNKDGASCSKTNFPNDMISFDVECTASTKTKSSKETSKSSGDHSSV